MTMVEPKPSGLSNVRIRMAEVLAALSLATDLGAGRPMGHAVRACFLGMQMAGELRLSKVEQGELYYSFFLMHSGCTALSLGMAPLIQGDELTAIGDAALRDETNLLDTLDWMRRFVSPNKAFQTRALNMLGMLLHARDGGEHLRGACEVAVRVAQRLGMPQGVQEAVRHYLERWDGKGPFGLAGNAIPLKARLLHTALKMETAYTARGRNAAEAMALEQKGKTHSFFRPLNREEVIEMEHTISPDGTRIAYRRSGAGQPLLLVHGSSADHQRWSPILPHFERHFTVYAMDRRGRGGSGDAPDYDLMREAEDVAAVVEAACEQAGEPVSVLGHSYGGLCSLEGARLTDKISRLILYEPPVPVGLPMYPTSLPDEMQALIHGGEFEDALEVFFREEVKMPEHELALFRQLPMWKERVKIVPTALRELVIDRTYRFEAEKFANFRVPTLLLLGGDSPPLFRQAIDTLHAALPSSLIGRMPGQQHIAMDTNPDLFVREVLQFLGAA